MEFNIGIPEYRTQCKGCSVLWVPKYKFQTRGLKTLGRPEYITKPYISAKIQSSSLVAVYRAEHGVLIVLLQSLVPEVPKFKVELRAKE